MSDAVLYGQGNTRAVDHGDGSYTPRAAPAADQDPIYDHAAGAAVAVTTSATVLTPPAGCKFVEFTAIGAAAWLRTDDAAAAKPTNGIGGGVSILLPADTPRLLPVTPGTACRAISDSGSSVVVACVPLEPRS